MKKNLLIRGVVGTLLVSSIVAATRAIGATHASAPTREESLERTRESDPAESQPAWWTVPINDNWSGWTSASRGRTRFTMHLATPGSEGQNATACWAADSMEQDVWFKFVADESGTWSVSLCAIQSEFDSRIAIYEVESGPPATVVTCDDDACSEGEPGGHASASFYAELGEAFYIQVGSADASPAGDSIMDITVE